MLPKSDPVSFVDAVPAEAQRMTSGMGAEVVGSGTASGDGAVDGIPSYSDIFASEKPIAEKVQLLFSATKQNIENQFVSVQPWGEFFDRSYVASPAGATEAISRISSNGSHFYSNYVILSLVCSSYILLINLPFFICMVLSVAGYFFIRSRAAAAAEQTDDGLIHLCGRSFSPTQLYVILTLFTAASFWITNGSSVVFWLALTSLGVSCAHAVMRRPPMEDSAFRFA